MNEGQTFVDMGDPAKTGREILGAMRDPLDAIWTHAIDRLGWKLARSRSVYAHWNGVDTLTITDTHDYDPDDTLAQFVFHEICHFLVEGLESRGLEDWGLSNQDPEVWIREGATHRLQAGLADRWGLRQFLAITGANRDYYDGLPPDPIHMPHTQRPDEDIRIRELAIRGWHLALEEPFRSILDEAFESTSRLALCIQSLPGQPADSHWRSVAQPHPLRMGVGPSGKTCGECAWFKQGKCLQVEPRGASTKESTRACARWEALFGQELCGDCGACCREGFSLAPVRKGEVMLDAHPEWIVRDSYGAHLPRPDGRCVALRGNGSDGPYRCAAYEHRPRSCSQLAPASHNCLLARRRVGLSAG